MCVLPFLLCFRISYYTYWSTHHWRDIKGQCQFYWMQTKQQANWSVYELLRHFICSQSHLTNVHGVLRWTGGPSRVYFILAPSIPRWGSRTMATLTRMKHLLKSECGSWQQQSATQQSCLYISRLIFAGLQPLLLLGNNMEKQDKPCVKYHRCFSGYSFLPFICADFSSVTATCWAGASVLCYSQ